MEGEWAQGGRTLFRYFKNQYDSSRWQWQYIGISSAHEDFWGSMFRCMLPLGDWFNLQQVTQRHSEQFKIKTAAKMAVAAVPRMAPGVQSSPVVATVATSNPDYSKAWFWLWFQPTQPPWMPAPVLSAVLQPPINSELPNILPINPFSVWVNQRWFLVICSPRTLTSTDEGEDSVPKVSLGEENLHSSLLQQGQPDVNPTCLSKWFCLYNQQRSESGQWGYVQEAALSLTRKNAESFENQNPVSAVYLETVQATTIVC